MMAHGLQKTLPSRDNKIFWSHPLSNQQIFCSLLACLLPISLPCLLGLDLMMLVHLVTFQAKAVRYFPGHCTGRPCQVPLSSPILCRILPWSWTLCGFKSTAQNPAALQGNRYSWPASLLCWFSDFRPRSYSFCFCPLVSYLMVFFLTYFKVSTLCFLS